MASVFSALQEKSYFTRKWGTDANVVEPYITGYHFAKFILPGAVTSVLPIQSASDVLSTTVLSATIPTGTLNSTEINGLGNIRWTAPTNMDVDSNVTFRFLETMGTPIRSIFHEYIKLIRDYRHGLSNLVAENYNKKNYGSTIYYWTTDPSGATVQYAACYAGAYPTKDPMDSFGHDLTANDKLEIDVDFKFDYAWQEDWVYTRCSGYNSQRNTSVVDVFAPTTV